MSSSFLANAELGFESICLPGGETGCLLLHGFTASPVEVKQLAEYLNRRGYTISAPLLPGHGTHPDDLNRVSYPEWLSVAESALSELKSKCRQVFLGGESMGGLIALRLAELHPEITGLLLYSPALQAKNLWAVPVLKHFIKYIRKAKSDKHFVWSGYTVYPLRGAAEMLRLQKLTTAELGKVTQPVLLITPENDTMVPKTVTGIIKDQSNARLMEIHAFADSDHCILLDKVQQTVFEITNKFIQKLIKTG